MTALDYQIQMCHKETYFAAEQEELKHRIQSYTGLHLSKKNRIENAQLVIRELTLKWDEEQQKGFREKDERMEALSHEQKQLRTRIEELETFLQNSRNTLQGWLKDHKPGWEENIGKLCDESNPVADRTVSTSGRRRGFLLWHQPGSLGYRTAYQVHQ